MQFKFFERDGEETGEDEGPRVDTQAFMITRAEGLVLAFRGTQQWDDLATNLQHAKRMLSGLPPRSVHTGFLSAYESVRAEILAEVDARAPTRVFVTGHSLGGALATLAALDIVQEHRSMHVTMYNFGCPRVGDWGYAGFYNSRMGESFRVVVRRDIVPQVPLEGWWPLGYRHVDEEHPLESEALPFLEHDLMQSYLPQLSEESDGQSFFDEPQPAGAEPISEPAVVER